MLMEKTKNKKLIFGLISATLLFTFSLSLAQVIVVRPENARQAARDLAKRSIINNHEDNPLLYKFNDYVLRQEIWAITRGVASIKKSSKCENIFKDVTNIIPNSWACLNIEPLVKNNIIARNDFFRPEEKITKAETLGMLIKALGFNYKFDSTKSQSWQEQIVDFAVKNNIIDKFYDYNSYATRWFVFKIAWVKRIIIPDKKQEKKKIQAPKNKFYSSEVNIK